jgi:ATP phosphoribosyltransferase
LVLTIALAKGRIFEEVIPLLEGAGIPASRAISDDSRKLSVSVPEAGLTLLLVKPADVPTYVEYGAADLGVVGKDVLLEAERDVMELMDLKIGACRMAVAGLPEKRPVSRFRVATKYPRIAERYFKEKGQQAEVIQLHGSVELAPLVGLADCIVDIVSTGRTLKENGLAEWEEIGRMTARLVVNRASYRLRHGDIRQLCDSLENALHKGVYV